jgi:hypothetical protein
MNAIVLADLVVQPVSVDFGVLAQGERYRFDHNVVERRLVLVAHLGELSAHLGRASHVEFSGEKERRHWAVRLGQSPRNGFPNLRERDVLEVSLALETFSGD